MNLYNNYNHTLREQFGERVQKISINAGFTCPNRDGSKGVGGCTFCNNLTFHPDYCKPEKSPLQQMQEGIHFFRKYESQLYLAYFQSYTNTYAPIDTLDSLYRSVLQHPKVVGIVVGTRPDCVNDALLNYFQELNRTHYVMIEYGIESTLDATLQAVNRGHNFQCSQEAIQATASRGIPVGAHLILGLPGETQADILSHADRISALPLTMLKLHQLQIVEGTTMAQQFKTDPTQFQLFDIDSYIDLTIDFLEHLNPEIGLERFVSQSPKEYLIAPDWGVKNFEFVAKLEKRMRQRNTFQGKLYLGWCKMLYINIIHL